jgi:hypothetical protein
MNILVLKEKHGDLYIEWPADLTVQEEICKHIITERLLNKFYKDEDRVDEAIKNNKCKRFLFSRQDYEYEDLEIVTPLKIY